MQVRLCVFKCSFAFWSAHLCFTILIRHWKRQNHGGRRYSFSFEIFIWVLIHSFVFWNTHLWCIVCIISHYVYLLRHITLTVGGSTRPRLHTKAKASRTPPSWGSGSWLVVSGVVELRVNAGYHIVCIYHAIYQFVVRKTDICCETRICFC